MCVTAGALGLTVGMPWFVALRAQVGAAAGCARAGASAGSKCVQLVTFFRLWHRSRCQAMGQSKIMAVSRSALGAGAGLDFWVDDQLWIDMMS